MHLYIRIIIMLVQTQKDHILQLQPSIIKYEGMIVITAIVDKSITM